MGNGVGGVTQTAYGLLLSFTEVLSTWLVVVEQGRLNLKVDLSCKFSITVILKKWILILA